MKIKTHKKKLYNMLKNKEDITFEINLIPYKSNININPDNQNI